jgi:hypothetical protein
VPILLSNIIPTGISGLSDMDRSSPQRLREGRQQVFPLTILC